MDETYEDELYQCIGYCQADEDSGCCLGCGRPLFPAAARETAQSPEFATMEHSFPVVV